MAHDSNQEILTAKMNGDNKFIAEIRNDDIVWVSDVRGTFELEYTICGDDDWEGITFRHGDDEYIADVNMYYKENGEIAVIVHAVANEKVLDASVVLIGW